jgi:predicted nuclease of predicted toxin-antitoxin system
MKFLLDENFPKAAGDFLSNLGHEVFDFRGTTLEGMKDDAVFAMAQRQEAVLLTTDRDFFHTITHLYEEHCGVIVIALRQPNRKAILDRLDWILAHVDPSLYRNRVFQLRDKACISYPAIT